MLPLMTFIVGCLILAAVLYHFYDTNREQVQALTDFGYDYCLTMIVTPLSEEGKRISFSKEKLTDPVTYTFEFGEGLKAFFGWLDDALVYIWE